MEVVRVVSHRSNYDGILCNRMFLIMLIHICLQEGETLLNLYLQNISILLHILYIRNKLMSDQSVENTLA